MENIAFDLPKKYPLIEPSDFAQGYIQSQLDTSLCIDSSNQAFTKRLGIAQCTKSTSGQKFKLSWHKDIRFGTTCFDVSIGGDEAPVNFYPCHGGQGNQLWRYDPDLKELRHVSSGRCLDMDSQDSKVFVSRCKVSKPSQRWIIENVDKEALGQWDKLM